MAIQCSYSIECADLFITGGRLQSGLARLRPVSKRYIHCGMYTGGELRMCAKKFEVVACTLLVLYCMLAEQER